MIIYTIAILFLGVVLAWVIGEFGRIYAQRKARRVNERWALRKPW